LAKDNASNPTDGAGRYTAFSSLNREGNLALPEQLNRSPIEDQLAQAKASRSQAETARQKIANEILEATKEVCQKLIADGEQTLQRAKKLEAEAQQKQREAQAELETARSSRADAQVYAEKVKSEAQKKAQEKLEQAQAIRSDADAYRDKVMAEVQQQAQEQLDHAQNVRHEADAYRERVIKEAKEQGQEILYLARSSAEHECTEMKRQAALEAQRTIAEAELIKAASQEELEAQRIYAEAAKLEAESLEVLAQVRAKLTGESPEPEDGGNGHWAGSQAPAPLNAVPAWERNEPAEEAAVSQVSVESAPESIQEAIQGAALEIEPRPKTVAEAAEPLAELEAEAGDAAASASGSRSRKRQSAGQKSQG
jgi:hypothetical protein